MALAARGLVAGHGGVPLLGPLDLEAPGGRFVCLIGANGAGKSTLIRTLCGMQPAIAGAVALDGQALHTLGLRERARRLAVVLTERVDGLAMRGEDVVSLGRHPHTGWGGRLGPLDREQVQAALGQMQALSLAGKRLTQMSDGERQKIMIARALAQQPRALVLDEATAFLDLPRRIEVMSLLRTLTRSRALAVLLSTHDLELALHFADTLWLIDGARQLHVGAPEDLALSGALASAFASDGLVFDLAHATLRPAGLLSRAARVSGTGMHAAWARRALARVGYADRADAPLHVHADARGYTVVRADGTPSCHPTLGHLATELEALARAPSSDEPAARSS
ncbi:iron(III) ABC transporter, ATP-binding protein, putative [plant metagenome]|uniref:Iron(III) ABC transporter, ATP-binding protein, putative n=1 Tax=plant metagenome TaxID=1297885 RepID=A0A484SAM8_9ZZZZ